MSIIIIARVFRHYITFHVFCKIFKKYYKSEIWQNFSYQTHTLYLFHISFTLENDNTISWWIYSTSLLSVGKTGDSCKDSVYMYMFYASICIWHCIFFRFIPFFILFRFPFRVLVTPLFSRFLTLSSFISRPKLTS